MKMSKPRPGDHPLLIMFVVGGVTSSELRTVRESIAASKSSLQVFDLSVLNAKLFRKKVCNFIYLYVNTHGFLNC